ncbi:MAG: hypothetical protein ACXAEX_17885 [Promethearchaeota archaeon]
MAKVMRGAFNIIETPEATLFLFNPLTPVLGTIQLLVYIFLSCCLIPFHFIASKMGKMIKKIRKNPRKYTYTI